MQRWLMIVVSYLLGLFMVIMSLGAIWQVFSRFVLNNPSTLTEEILRYMLVWGTMIGAVVGFARQEHMALTLLKGHLGVRANWWLALIIHVLILILFLGFFSLGGLRITQNGMRQLSAALNMPMGYIYAIIPLMAISVGIVQLWHIIQLFRSKGKGS